MHRRFSLKELKEIIEEDLNAGEEEYKKGRYNISSIAFFKAIVGICDYLIYRERGILPSNHTKRFEILRKYYPQLYEIVDTDFEIYRAAYLFKISREDVEKVRKDAWSLYQEI